MTSRARPAEATWLCRSLQPLLAARRSGVVRGVWRRSLMVAIDDQLIGVVTDRAGRLPGAIGLGSVDDIETLGLRVGDAIGLEPGGLFSRTVRSGASVISVRHAEPWDARLAPLDRASSRPRRVEAERLARAWRLVPEGGLLGRGHDRYDAWPAIDALLDGLAEGRAPAVARASAALVGRGPGLTPSGDDLLVGLTAALTGFGHPSARQTAAVVARGAHQRTTSVAETYHGHARSGRYSETLHDLVDALSVDGGDLSVAVTRALAWGATSGADTMIGVLLGAGLCVDIAGRAAQDRVEATAS